MWGWLEISSVGRSKLVQSMSVWMLLTPIAAKLLGSVDHISLGSIAPGVNVPLALPFSWKVFFYCSLCFAVGNLIYSLRAPEIIKRFRNYADFEEQEGSLYLLIEATKRELRQIKDYFPDTALKETVVRYTPDDDISDSWQRTELIDRWWKGMDSLKHSSRDNLPDIFSSFRLILSSTRPYWLYICTIFYAGGFIGLLCIIWENTVYVVLLHK
ncbi:hypothetical protein [Methylomicrobium lacus]|uniref:hypothetical protein n=1 Tax=Methylomicrobium lacus TaxID=136992 RepID=UPI0035A81B19